MKGLFFILIFLFTCSGITPTSVTSINMNNKLLKFEVDHLKPGNPKIVSPDFPNTSNKKLLNRQKNNPGNLRCFKTGEFRVFSTVEKGYAALLHDLDLKISGRSVWTDSTTTIYDFINIYAPAFENDVNTYIKIFCYETGLKETDLLKTQNIKVVAQGIIKVENSDLYCQLYSSKN